MISNVDKEKNTIIFNNFVIGPITYIVITTTLILPNTYQIPFLRKTNWYLFYGRMSIILSSFFNIITAAADATIEVLKYPFVAISFSFVVTVVNIKEKWGQVTRAASGGMCVVTICREINLSSPKYPGPEKIIKIFLNVDMKETNTGTH